MLRFILAVVALGAPVQAVQGQVLLAILFGDKLSTETFQLGIKLDGAFTGLTEVTDADTRFGWAFGAFGEIKLSDTWSLQPELSMTAPGGAKEFLGTPPGDPRLEEIFGDVLQTRKMSYTNLSFLVKLKTGRFGIGFGPQVGYLRKAEDVYEGKVIDVGDFTMTKDVVDEHNRWDVGLTALLEFYLSPEKEMLSPRIHVTPYLGLSDTLKDNPGDAVKNFGVQVGIGFAVGGGSEG
jgi:hypothetical protein